MRFMSSMSTPVRSTSPLSLLTIGVLSLMAWALVAGPVSAASAAKAKTKKKVTATRRETIERGRLDSFQNGTLKIKVRQPGGTEWAERRWQVASGTEVVSYIRGVATKGVAPEAFKPWEQNPGVSIVVRVSNGKVRLVEIGTKKVPESTPKKPADELTQRD